MGFFDPYIKEEWKHAIKNYKFNSTDASLVYVHITSPMCNRIVEYIPTWITLTGSMFNVISNLVVNYYSGLDGKGDIPTWAIVMVAIFYPMYHIFDLIDGKQARKTGQSSPLGLLMDHGCDALTTFLYTMTLGSVFKLEGAFWYSFIWLLTSITFFACTWEEYQTGRLDFPCFHGVSEGTFISSAIVFFTAAVGQQFWLTPINFFGTYYRLNYMFVTCFFIASMMFALTSFKKVYQSPKTTNFLKALSNTAVFFYLVFTMLVVAFYSKSELLDKYPKLIVYMYGFTFSLLVGHLQLAHLADAKFQQFSFPIIFFLVTLSSISLLQFDFIGQWVNIEFLILFFIAFNFLAWLHFAYFVSEELCQFLGIYRFTRKIDLQSVAIK